MYTSLCIEHIQSGINLQVFESPSLAEGLKYKLSNLDLPGVT